MVGDRWRDVEAGSRAGCRVVFIDRGYAETPPLKADSVAPGLPEAAEWILRQEERA
jgi:D-glycero-D-manno-heptose 1,7-bisphosphate phosphatase